MKRIAMILLVALAVAGVAVAQNAPAPWGPPGWNQPQAQSVKVEGRLALINGTIGIKSGAKTYYVPMLARMAGFIEGIKEGASVKLEGYERQLPYAPEYYTLMATKLSVGGKDYDLGQYGGFGMRGQFGGFGGMRGGRQGMMGRGGW
jgi:hypothetical protein